VTQSFRGSVAPSRTGEPIHDCAGEINHHYWKYALDHQEKAPRRRPPRSGTPHQTKGAGGGCGSWPRNVATISVVVVTAGA
jgi:hypothetical protein